MFGDNLKQARKDMDLTLEQLAELYNKKYNAGLSKGTLSKYENNRQEPMISAVNNLASILNVSTDFLLGNKIKKITNNSPQEQKLLTNYNKLDDTDQTKLIDYSDKLANSDKYKDTVTINIAARNGDTTLELTKEQYEEFIRLAKTKGRKELPDDVV